MYGVADFAGDGDVATVTRVLSRLVSEGLLVRLVKGLYLYPSRLGSVRSSEENVAYAEHVNKEGASEVYAYLHPTVGEVVGVLGRKGCFRASPVGMAAVWALGLCTDEPSEQVYATDGTPRTIVFDYAVSPDMSERRRVTVRLKRAGKLLLGSKSRLMPIVVEAMMAMGEGNLDADKRRVLRHAVSREKGRSDMIDDLALAPEWIRRVLQGALSSGARRRYALDKPATVTDDGCPWLCLCVQAAQRDTVDDLLKSAGVQTFVPMCETNVAQCGGVPAHKEMRPVVGNYLFARMAHGEDEMRDRLRLLSESHDVRFRVMSVTDDYKRRYVQIASREMYEFRVMCYPDRMRRQFYMGDEAKAKLASGKPVRVTHGLFSGFTGVLTRESGGYVFLKSVGPMAVSVKLSRWMCSELK